MSLEWIQGNWAIAVGFMTGAVLWGKTVNDVAKNKEDIKTALTDIGVIKDSIARVETHQEYSRKGIDDIRAALASRRNDD